MDILKLDLSVDLLKTDKLRVDPSGLKTMIFFQTEAPMLLRPFLNHMTRSELHTVMTCGFASISGGILGAYVQFGVGVSLSFLCCCSSFVHTWSD